MVSPSVWTLERCEKLRWLALQELTLQQVVAEIGSTREAVLRQMKVMKLPPLPVLPPADDKGSDGRFFEGYDGQKARLSILELEAHSCRFPMDTRRGVRFCGLVRKGISSYCEAHAERCENRHYVRRERR